jgi:hypothetical protein
MLPLISVPAVNGRALGAAARRAAGPALGCVSGLLVGGWFGALAGLVIGGLVGELFRRSGVSGSLQKYLIDTDSRRAGPPVDEAFPGACLLAGFVAAFDPGAELGGKAESADAAGADSAGGFERVAVTRIALEGGSGLGAARLGAFSRLAQSLLPSSASYSAASLLARYFGQAGGDPVAGAICAWALFRRRWPEPERERLAAMRRFLSGSGCPEDAVWASEAIVYPDRAADWELLGLKPGASRDDMKKSFRALSLAFHPDGLGAFEPEKRQEAEEAFRRVRTAYERLSGGREG